MDNLPPLALVPTAPLPCLPAPVAPAQNPVEMLLADKRSPATRRAYRADLFAFFGGGAHPAAVAAFLQLDAPAVALRLATYKASMLDQGLAEATVNRRLAAVRSLLKLSHRIGLARTDGRGLVDGEKVTAYRDTRGVDVKQIKRLLALPDTLTLRGKRDRALLVLLAENALRRAEVCALDVSDLEPQTRRLFILGKGRGTQKEPITLSPRCVGAITGYLLAAGHTEGALFRNVERRPGSRGRRLTANGLYRVIGEYGKRLDVRLTPHQIRHSSITAALDATKGDVRRVQRLSRHKDVRTLQRYDDSRADLQGEVTGILSKVF